MECFNDQPKVSFLIAAFNEEDYLLECVQSCLNQEDVAIEVCIVDDGSADRTRQIIEELSIQDSRVKYTIFPVNKGKVSAFNEAYALASGEYLALVGADDVNAIRRAKISIEKIRAEAVELVYSDYFVCDERLQVVRREEVSSSVTLEQLCFNNKISGGTVLFDRSVAASIFPIPSGLKFEDWWIAFVAISRFKVAHIKEPLLFYRHHGLNDSISKNFYKSKSKDFQRHFRYYDAFNEYCKKNDLKDAFLISSLQESEFFKRLYVAGNLYERVRISLSHLKSHGFPKTRYGWFALLLVSIFGPIVFDMALVMKKFVK